jgi:hypothetical protein
VLAVAGLLALASVTALPWPRVTHALRERAERAAFQTADDALQAGLVRTCLGHGPDQTERTLRGHAMQPMVFLDTTSAPLCALDQPAPRDANALLAAAREGALVDAADRETPLPLQRLLDRITDSGPATAPRASRVCQ